MLIIKEVANSLPEFQRSLDEDSDPDDQRQFLAVLIRCGASAKK